MMDSSNNPESDESLSEDSLEVCESGDPVSKTRSSDKISCALCVNRNKGNSAHGASQPSAEQKIVRINFKFIKFMTFHVTETL